ncbi:tectonic-2 isoform X1 [Clarias gariepinus]|uniref:tectonic-2 isoform X1 n=2 Tax=Clarias gariepinus TaxID=13013 RepID=UPI00234C714D|nr:tectonic-2 isoform X1 [Clarias gariepinus]XP_053337172.1 tectonic-2 isoform X1 [Clarias gariepinus]XP_053337173.1 tectonic-2 isoform X1 [Clarias gariepinus]
MALMLQSSNLSRWCLHSQRRTQTSERLYYTMVQTRLRDCFILLSRTFILFALLYKEVARCDVVFMPSVLAASGPRASAFLVGNLTGVSLTIGSVSPASATGHLPPASCVPSQSSQWILSDEPMGKGSLLVRVSLNRSLQLCASANETNCCSQLLCVRETVMVSACLGDVPQASLILQAQIYAKLLPAGPVLENKTAIPNQVYQPLGQCPCDLTENVCDVRCCCDKDCAPELLWLFTGRCLAGPFGGMISPVPDYVCSAQSAVNDPDWFPFLCVTSALENNPFLGLFYDGTIVTPKPAPSFQAPQLTAPVPPTNYHQGAPIFTTDNQYFTIPQVSMLGQCLEKAPVAFLQNFEALCVRTLQSCPAEPANLNVTVRGDQGGVIAVAITDEVITDLSLFLSNPPNPATETQSCLNVVLSLSYTFQWKGNGITAISVTRRIGNITFSPGVTLTTRFSAVFINGNITAQPNSGNPGYQVGRPVIGGVLDDATGGIRRASFSLWQGVKDGLCSSANLRPVFYGINSTSGCLLPVSLLNLTECIQLRETVRSTLAALVPAALVSSTGKPDFSTPINWTRATNAVQNSTQTVGSSRGVCFGVPAHLHIHIRSVVMGTINGVPQKIIQAVELNFKTSTWSLECDAAQGSVCLTADLTQKFPVTSSVTFTEAPVSGQSPMSRFRINFTEFDCDRNDVCWPELAFPLTPYYTGEPYSQALAKGLILVFFFIAASVLGTPWRQIRQAWSNSLL